MLSGSGSTDCSPQGCPVDPHAQTIRHQVPNDHPATAAGQPAWATMSSVPSGSGSTDCRTVRLTCMRRSYVIRFPMIILQQQQDSQHGSASQCQFTVQGTAQCKLAWVLHQAEHPCRTARAQLMLATIKTDCSLSLYSQSHAVGLHCCRSESLGPRLVARWVSAARLPLEVSIQTTSMQLEARPASEPQQQHATHQHLTDC